MHRRSLLARLVTIALWPRATHAEPLSAPARVGYLGIARGPLYDAFLNGVREYGYVDGQNLLVERRQYEGNIPRLPALAAELVGLKVDVIFATGPAPVKAVTKATRAIPLVAIDLESDPIQSGFAVSLSRPGTNLTGVFLDLPDLIGKWLDFMLAMVPRLSRMAILWDPATGRAQLEAATVAARALNVELKVWEVHGPEDFDRQLTAAARARPDALVQLSSPLIFLQAKTVSDFALKTRLPAISLFRAFLESGGLMSYGPDIADLYRRCGLYVGRVLKGVRPGELPIERPSKFELVINLKTAKALGLTIPPSLLLRADQVIE